MEYKPTKAMAAAVSAAVFSYIRLQEEASTPQVAVALSSSTTADTASLYGASGRQQMMEMRRLLSLRMGRR